MADHQTNRIITILQKNFIFGYDIRDEFLFFCPFCPHVHHKPKLSINIKKNFYKCWVCGEHGHIGKLWKYFKFPHDVVEYRKLCGSYSEQQIQDALEKRESQRSKIVNYPDGFVSIGDCLESERGSYLTEALTYLTSVRNWTLERIIRWRLGICFFGKFKDRIIFPSFDAEGNLNYFLGRTFLPHHFMTYMNLDVPKAEIIFNEVEIDWSRDVHLVEGAFDATVLENSVPLLGKTLNQKSRLFKEIIKHHPNIYMALDSNALRENIKIIESLLTYDMRVFIIDTRGYKDIEKMGGEEATRRKELAEEVNFDNIHLLSMCEKL